MTIDCRQTTGAPDAEAGVCESTPGIGRVLGGTIALMASLDLTSLESRTNGEKRILLSFLNPDEA
jgi:hypothetical protein